MQPENIYPSEDDDFHNIGDQLTLRRDSTGHDSGKAHLLKWKKILYICTGAAVVIGVVAFAFAVSKLMALKERERTSDIIKKELVELEMELHRARIEYQKLKDKNNARSEQIQNVVQEKSESDNTTMEEVMSILVELGNIQNISQKFEQKDDAQQMQMQEIMQEGGNQTNEELKTIIIELHKTKNDYETLKVEDKVQKKQIKELEKSILRLHCLRSSVNGRQIITPDEEAVCDDRWLIIQRNYDNQTLNFDRNWNEYKRGFGNISEDFWIGLERMHEVTKHHGCRLRVDLWDNYGNLTLRDYGSFYVENERDNYRLHVSGYAQPWLPLAFTGNSNWQFTTKDRDNDGHPDENCAHHLKSGWWYTRCGESALNGAYQEPILDDRPFWGGTHFRFSKSAMKLRCDSP